MKIILISILSFFQFPFLIEGWLSFSLNLLIRLLLQYNFFFNIILLGGIVSFIWWPLDMLSAVCWATCEYAKVKLEKRNIDFSEAFAAYIAQYPKL